MRISVLIKHRFLFIDNSQANQTNSNRKMKCCFNDNSNSQKQPFADILQIGLLRNFATLTEKHLCWSLFSLKRDSNTGAVL